MFVGNHIVIQDAILKYALPENISYLQPQLDAYNEAADAVTETERVALINSAHGKNPDPVSRAILNGAHEKRVRLNFWAENIALMLYEIEEVAEQDWIQITNEQDHRYRILETYSHGEAPHQVWIEANDTSMFKFYALNSGIIKYPTMNINTGAVKATTGVERDATRAMEQKVNTDLYALMDAGYGVYPAGTQVVDPRVVSGTRPTTSILDLKSEGSITLEILKSTIDHFLRLGLSLRTIVINPTEFRDTWDWQTVVSTTSSGSQDGRTIVTTRIKEGIENTGGIQSLYGQEFVWILDPIRPLLYLDAIAGPVGTLFHKPSMERFTHYDEDEMDKKDFGENFNGVKMKRVIKPLTFGQQPLNKLQVQFNT